MMEGNQGVTMEAGYSPGDPKMLKNDKENHVADTPAKDESKLPLDSKHENMDVSIKDPDSAKYGQAVESQSDSENNQDGKKGKKKHRRRQRGGKHHRRWKPYDKMSWSEKKELEEKETRRATQKREAAFKSGHPVAPYNTTQFLMDDHEAVSPDLHRNNSKDSNNSNSTDSSSDYYEEEEVLEFNDGFQEKNFIDTFNDYRKQELLNRSKEELVRDYVEMESKLETLEKGIGSRGDKCSKESSDSGDEKDFDITEYLRLKSENEQLKRTNLELQEQLKRVHSNDMLSKSLNEAS